MNDPFHLNQRLKRVMWGIDPLPGESLLGLIARSADHNVLDSTFAITGQVGQVYGNRANSAISPVVRLTDLAHVLRVEPAEVINRSYLHSDGDKLRDFFGITLRFTEIESKLRRFSPASLRRSPFHRAIWDCRLLPICPESWELLIETCHRCNTPQRWLSANGITNCDSCAADLTEAPTSNVAEADRAILGWFANLVSPFEDVRKAAWVDVAPSLSHLSVSLLIDFAVRLLAVIDPWVKKATFNGWRQDQGRYIRALLAVIPMLRDWPHSYLRCARDAKSERGTCWRASSMKSFDRFLKKLLNDNRAEFRIVGDAAINAIVTKGNFGLQDHINLCEAAALLGREVATLKKWRRKNLLRTTVGLHNGDLAHCLDRQEIASLTEFSSGRLSAEGLAVNFGMTFHGVEQLICLELLTPMTHPWVQAVYDSPQFTLQETQRFLKRLRDQARPISEIRDGQTLATSMHGIGGKLQAWGPIIQALLGGKISFALQDAGRSEAERIVVDRASRPKLAQLKFDSSAFPEFYFEPAMSILDAAANLNVPAPKAKFLSSLQQPKKFTHPYRKIPSAAVEDLAARYISIREITSITGKTWRGLQAELKAIGFDRVHPVGWDRACVAVLGGALP